MPTESPFTGNIRADRSTATCDAYEQNGGYRALRKALESMTPAEVTNQVKDSNLRGRGGSRIPGRTEMDFGSDRGRAAPEYLVANADEMEPGTLKDRLLLEAIRTS